MSAADARPATAARRFWACSSAVAVAELYFGVTFDREADFDDRSPNCAANVTYSDRIGNYHRIWRRICSWPRTCRSQSWSRRRCLEPRLLGRERLSEARPVSQVARQLRRLAR